MNRSRRGAANRAFGIIAGLAVTGAGAAAFVHARWGTPATTSLRAAASAIEEPGEPPPDWCPSPYEPIAGGGCLAASKGRGGSERLIVHLHGR